MVSATSSRRGVRRSGSATCRAAGTGTLRVGRRTEAFRADELADDAKPVIIRAYLKAWAWEVGRFFDGLGKDSTDAEIAAVAAGFPVFRIG